MQGVKRGSRVQVAEWNESEHKLRIPPPQILVPTPRRIPEHKGK